MLIGDQDGFPADFAVLSKWEWQKCIVGKQLSRYSRLIIPHGIRNSAIFNSPNTNTGRYVMLA
jgi:hypothetical protein